MPVNSPHALYDKMKAKWDRLRDCSSGRDAVIAAGTKYLPALPGKPGSDFGQRGNFYNALRRTVQGLAGAITQKQPIITMPVRLKALLEDMTLAGVPTETIVRMVLEEVLLLARYGILVDMSNTPGATAQRPYVVTYKAEDIPSWRVESLGGDDILTRVVLYETEEEPDPKDPFVLKAIEQYRVLELVENIYTQTVWRKKDDNSGEWEPWIPPNQKTAELRPQRRGVTLDFIPFVFVGPTSGSPDPETLLLLDLADVNLAHWRNSADHEYGLHLIALPTPWVSGHKASTDDNKLQIGPSVVWELEKDGGAGMLEYRGEGLSDIKAAMDEKQKQMATLGARLLEEQAKVAETATAVGLRHAGEHATLRSVAQSVERQFSRVLRIMGWWMGTEATPIDVKAQIEFNKDFFAVRATPDEVRALLTAWQADAISFDTLYRGLQRGGWVREGVTSEEEQKAIDAAREGRAQPPAAPPADDDDDDDDEED